MTLPAFALLLALVPMDPPPASALKAPALLRGWDVSQPVWQSLGPSTLLPTPALPNASKSGAVFALASTGTYPGTVYAGTSGGLWRATADLSQATWSWSCVSDTLPKASLQAPPSVGAIAIDPASPSKLYLGLGTRRLPSTGFYTSANSGLTWTPAAGVSHTHTTAIVAMDSGVVLVSGDKGLFRSTDGGATFSAIALGGNATRGVPHLIATGPQRLVCATIENWTQAGGTTLWQSTNSGLSWNQATVVNAAAVATMRHVTFAASALDPSFVYALADSGSGSMLNGVLASGNGGATWTYKPAAAGSFFNDPPGTGGASLVNRMLAVYPWGTQTLFASGLGGYVYRSLDGGTSWARFVEPHHGGYVDHHAGAWLPSPNSGTAPPLLYGNDSGVFLLRAPTARTTPAGADQSFLDTRKNAGLASIEVWCLGSTAAAGGTSKLTISLQDLYSAYRSGASSTFFSQSLPQPGSGDGVGSLLHSVNAALALAVNAVGRPHRSQDGGQSFVLSDMGIPPGEIAGLTSVMTPGLVADGLDGSGNTVYFRGVNGVHRSTSFGGLWSPLVAFNPSPSGGARVLAVEGGALLVGSWGKSIHLSLNSGQSQVQLAAPSAAGQGGFWNRGIGALAFKPVPGNPPPLMVGLAPDLIEPLPNTLFRSVDGGASWTTPALPVPQAIYSLKPARNLPTRWLAGTAVGVLFSDDDGAHWVSLGHGLPVVRVMDLWVSPDGTRIRAATFGRGVWEITIPPFPAF